MLFTKRITWINFLARGLGIMAMEGKKSVTRGAVYILLVPEE